MKALWSTLPAGIKGPLGGPSSSSNTLCEVRRSRVLVEFHEGIAAHINTTSCE